MLDGNTGLNPEDGVSPPLGQPNLSEGGRIGMFLLEVSDVSVISATYIPLPMNAWRTID